VEAPQQPAAFGSCATWLHWNRSGRCTHLGHLTSGPSSLSTASLHPDAAAVTTTTAAPDITVLQAASLTILVSVVLVLSCVAVCVNILELSSHCTRLSLREYDVRILTFWAKLVRKRSAFTQQSLHFTFPLQNAKY